MIQILNPLSRSFPTACVSSEMFLCSFVRQKSTLLDGHLKRWHPCICQKQPCIKITAWCFGNVRSGFPGKSFLCNEYRNPFAKSPFLTKSSGLVFLLRMPAIIRLRFSFETISAIMRTLLFYFPQMEYVAAPQRFPLF